MSSYTQYKYFLLGMNKIPDIKMIRQFASTSNNYQRRTIYIYVIKLYNLY